MILIIIFKLDFNYVLGVISIPRGTIVESTVLYTVSSILVLGVTTLCHGFTTTSGATRLHQSDRLQYVLVVDPLMIDVDTLMIDDR
jgi:hypothetical protein